MPPHSLLQRPVARYLVVNADDFGMSPGVNRGIIRAHECGIVTSASLMVRWPASAEAAAYSREHPNLSVGLHVDLGEWAFQHDAWVPLYQVVALDDDAAVVEEVFRQLDLFRQLVGTEPTHIDSHQHVHREKAVRPVLTELAAELGVPLRHFTPGVRYCGNFYGQTTEGQPFPSAISTQALARIVTAIQPGLTELACHPADEADNLHTMYRDERLAELEALCDTRIRVALAAQEVELCSFADVGRWL
jgi:chitin disaccharide deacetylase